MSGLKSWSLTTCTQETPTMGLTADPITNFLNLSLKENAVMSLTSRGAHRDFWNTRLTCSLGKDMGRMHWPGIVNFHKHSNVLIMDWSRWNWRTKYLHDGNDPSQIFRTFETWLLNLSLTLVMEGIFIPWKSADTVNLDLFLPRSVGLMVSQWTSASPIEKF